MIRYLNYRQLKILTFPSVRKFSIVSSWYKNVESSNILENIRNEVDKKQNYEPLSKYLKDNNEESFNIISDLIPQFKKDENNLNLILEKFVKYNFSLINLVNQGNKNSLTTQSLIEILKKNPNRVKTSFEIFEEFYLNNSKSSLYSNEDRDKNLLLNVLIEKCIKEEENLINILFVYMNYIKDDDLKNSQLIIDFLREKKLLNLLKLKNNDYLVSVLNSINLMETGDDDVYDLILLLLNNVENIKNNEIFSDLPILNKILSLLIRFHKISPDEKVKYNNYLSECVSKVNEINLKYGFSAINVSLFYWKIEKSLNLLQEFIYSYLLKNFSGMNNNREYFKLREEFLKYIAIELNDFKLFNEYYNELSKFDELNKESLQLLMSKVLCIKSINEPQQQIWDQLIDVTIPPSVNEIKQNINHYIDIPIVKEEIMIARKYFQLMIIHRSFKNLDDSVEIFNNVIEDFKNLDKQTLKNNSAETNHTTFLVDSLIKAALLNKKRELAYVILEKSIQNNLVAANPVILKSNFKSYGELIEDKDLTNKYVDYIKTYIRNI